MLFKTFLANWNVHGSPSLVPLPGGVALLVLRPPAHLGLPDMDPHLLARYLNKSLIQSGVGQLFDLSLQTCHAETTLVFPQPRQVHPLVMTVSIGAAETLTLVA